MDSRLPLPFFPSPSPLFPSSSLTVTLLRSFNYFQYLLRYVLSFMLNAHAQTSNYPAIIIIISHQCGLIDFLHATSAVLDLERSNLIHPGPPIRDISLHRPPPHPKDTRSVSRNINRSYPQTSNEYFETEKNRALRGVQTFVCAAGISPGIEVARMQPTIILFIDWSTSSGL